MTRIGVESRMPGHEEMKRVQFLRCFHKPQPAIVFDSRCHAASERKDQFCAGKALQRHAEVRHSNARAAFCTDSRQLLVRNCLYPGIGGHNDVARGQVLPKWQPAAEVAVARDGANPTLLVKPFHLEVRRQEPIINVENKIELPVFHQLRDATLPRKKFKLYLIASGRVLPTQGRKHDCTNVIRAGDAEMALLPPDRTDLAQRDSPSWVAIPPVRRESFDLAK